MIIFIKTSNKNKTIEARVNWDKNNVSNNS